MRRAEQHLRSSSRNWAQAVSTSVDQIDAGRSPPIYDNHHFTLLHLVPFEDLWRTAHFEQIDTHLHHCNGLCRARGKDWEPSNAGRSRKPNTVGGLVRNIR